MPAQPVRPVRPVQAAQPQANRHVNGLQAYSDLNATPCGDPAIRRRPAAAKHETLQKIIMAVHRAALYRTVNVVPALAWESWRLLETQQDSSKTL